MRTAVCRARPFGARFGGASLLLVFRNGGVARPPGRSLADWRAARAAKEQRPAGGWGAYGQPFHLGRVAPSVRAACSLRDLEWLLPFSSHLAREYRVSGAPAPALCEWNAELAGQLGYRDLKQTWALLRRAVEPLRWPGGAGTASAPLAWPALPMGRKLVQTVLLHYHALGDIQTLATVACILRPLRIPRACLRSSTTTSSRPRLPSAPMLASWPAGTCTSAAPTSSAASATSRPPCRPAPRSSAPPLHSLRPGAGRRRSQPANCPVCSRVFPACSICHATMRGLVVACLACGHAGHAHHMHDWFIKGRRTACPTGCGCKCSAHLASAFGQTIG